MFTLILTTALLAGKPEAEAAMGKYNAARLKFAAASDANCDADYYFQSARGALDLLKRP